MLEKFVQVGEIKVPLDNGAADQVYVTATYDPTSHFEDTTQEVLHMWKTLTGTDLDLTTLPEDEDQ